MDTLSFAIPPSAETIWSSLLAILIDSGVKGVILLSLASLIVLSMRRSSASARHLVWALALCGLLLLPIVSMIMPAWQLPILPRAVAPSAQSSPAPAPRTQTAPTTAAPVVSEPVVANHFTPAQPATTSFAPPEIEEKSQLPPAFWALAIWMALALAILAPLAGGMIAVARLIHSGRPLGEFWPELMRTLASSLGLRRRVQVLASHPETMPMATGYLSATIILPGSAGDWPDEKRRAVLLHELAHIKRRDCLTHALARVAVAMNWFNPLAWIAIRRLRIERERACDDLVLTAGERPSTYADHLLEIARTMHTGTLASAAAITMAKRSQLEGRLLAILDAGRNRGAIRKWVLIIGLILLLAITIPLAALKLGEARVFARMTPQEKAEFDAWYTQKLTLPAEALQPETFTPETLQAVRDFNALAGRIKDLASAASRGWPKENTLESPEFAAFIERNRATVNEAAPILAAFKAVIARPDYSINAWETAAEYTGIESAFPRMDFTAVRGASRLLYFDSVLKLKDGRIDEAIASADALVACAQMRPFSPTINKMIGIAILGYGLQSYQSIADRVPDPAFRRKIAENLASHRAKIQYFPPDKTDFMVMDQIGMTAEARRRGLTANFQNKSGFDIMIETNRLSAAYLEKFVLPKAADATERAKIQKAIDGYRKNIKSFSPGIASKWINPITAATLYSIARPGMVQADKVTAQRFEQYDALIILGAGTTPLNMIYAPEKSKPAADMNEPAEYCWRLNTSETLQVIDRGFIIPIDGSQLQNWGGGVNQAGDEGPVALIVRTKIDQGNLVMTTIRQTRTGHTTLEKKIPIPRGATMEVSSRKVPFAIDSRKFVSLWECRFVRGGETIQTIAFGGTAAPMSDKDFEKAMDLHGRTAADFPLMRVNNSPADTGATSASLQSVEDKHKALLLAKVTETENIYKTTKAKFEARVESRSVVTAAERDYKMAKAELAGDPIAAAQARYDAAVIILKDQKGRYDIGAIDRAELGHAEFEVKQADYELAKAKQKPVKTETPSMDQIRKYFEERAVKVRSMDLRFDILQTLAQGSMIEPTDRGLATGTYPEKEQTVSGAYRLLTQADSRRLDACFDIWFSGDKPRYFETQETKLFGPSGGTEYHKSEDGSVQQYQNDRDDGTINLSRSSRWLSVSCPI